jgi:hypothetical protein
MDKLDKIVIMLEEVLMRVQRIEHLLDFEDDEAPEDIQKAFDKIFERMESKPNLTIVSNNTNIVDFDKNE